MVRRLGGQHGRWYTHLRAEVELTEGPIVDADGAIVAEPLFWFSGHACFAEPPGKAVLWRLQDLGFRVLPPGADWR